MVAKIAKLALILIMSFAVLTAFLVTAEELSPGNASRMGAHVRHLLVGGEPAKKSPSEIYASTDEPKKKEIVLDFDDPFDQPKQVLDFDPYLKSPDEDSGPWTEYSDNTSTVTNQTDQFEYQAQRKSDFMAQEIERTNNLRNQQRQLDDLADAQRRQDFEYQQRRQASLQEEQSSRYRINQNEPATRTDQNGRTYSQPPGSTFATDTQTGQQCFVNGAFIHC